MVGILYDGEDDKEEYQEWKDELLEIGFEEFFEEMKEEHLDTFIEYLQQRAEIDADMEAQDYSTFGKNKI